MTPRVSAVVPTYNGRERLVETVPALLREPELHELIVVVDGSEDGSIELLEEMAAADERLRPLLVENGGDNRARQVGIEHATGDIVLFLDDDVVAHPGLVAGHARHHAARDRLVVIGYMPVATPIGPAPEDVGVRLYSQYYETQCREYERRPDRILHNLWNGNVSVPRAECLALGISNPAYDTRFGSSNNARTTPALCSNLTREVPFRAGRSKREELRSCQFRGHHRIRSADLTRHSSVNQG